MALLEKPTPAPATSAHHRVVAGSTIAVMLGTLASMVFGFAREVVNAQYFGERWELDAFLVAAIIPTLVFGVFNGSLVTALVPIFSGYFANDEQEEAWRLSSTVINVLLVLLSACALVGWFAAPLIVRVVAAGFPPNEADVTTHMTRVMMPTIIATSIAGVLQALLNAQQRYKAASLQGLALNVCAIAGVLLLFHAYGIFGLVFGTAVGAVAQLVVQLPSYLRRCRYRFVIDLQHPGLRHLFAILGPIVIGSAVGQTNLLFDKYFASTLQPGNIAAMQYATKVVGFPQQLFAAAIATVIFPILSAHYASNDQRSLREMTSTGLRMTALITIPAALGLIVLAQPIISVLFERGEFTHGDLVRTAGAMQFYAFGLLGLAASIVLTRCFFAMRDSRTPVIVASAVMLLNVACSALLVRPFGINGLAFANSLSSLTEAAVLVALLGRRVGFIDSGLFGSSVARICAAACSMAVVSWTVNAVLWHDAGTIWQHAATLAVDLLMGGAVFLVVGTLLRVRELATLLAMGAEYVGRRAARAAGA
jgi:putative peptidoglycan lipid II flippase